MNVAVGDRVGAYEILAAIGAGGMGTVYRARDTRLRREVAIKFSNVPFDQRFMREARAIAALNHPNVCQLYDVGDDYLVMELVRGESPRGPLPLAVARDYARQIADALDAAHGKGIVHRDLKPANIKITPDGVVKILDFGLAKEVLPASVAADPAQTEPRTQIGVIVGTEGYMAPEQLQGEVVDKRADIWAYGVVLYELLTGSRPFDGQTSADVFAAVLAREPDLGRVPDEARPLLQSCLAKAPKDRLRDIGDAQRLWTERAPAGTVPSLRWLPWGVAAALAAALAAVPYLRSPSTAGPDASVTHWALDADISGPAVGFAISRDGRRIAYVAQSDARQRIWTRDLAELAGRPIEGTDNAQRPFFSPNGEWVAFFTAARAGRLMKAPVAGEAFNTRGAVVLLCDGANYYGGAWGDDDTIVFSGPEGLTRVKASGGACEPVTTADAQGDHRWPQFLPGGKKLVFTIGVEGAFDSARIAVLDLETREQRIVQEGGTAAAYVPSGHLVFVRGGQMFAVPFDVRGLRTLGAPRVVIESLFHVAAGGYAAFAFSDTGTLLYETPSLRAFEQRDAHGNVRAIQIPAGTYQYFRVSPDGTRLVLNQAGRADIALAALAGGAPQRITVDGTNFSPLWSADGTRVAFGTFGKGIFKIKSDGSGPIEPLLETVMPVLPWDWAPNGTLLYLTGEPLGIWVLAADGSAPKPLLSGDGVQYFDPEISPDGRRVAYVSATRGQAPRLFVTTFPEPGAAVQISPEPALNPRWSAEGKELYFFAPSSQAIMVAGAEPDGLRFSTPRPLIPLSARSQAPGSAHWFDVDADGRFVMPSEVQPEGVRVTTHWLDALRRLAPSTR